MENELEFELFFKKKILKTLLGDNSATLKDMTKILIVDDNLVILKFLSLALKDKGYEIILAHNGKEGLEKWQENQPELVILDIMMPDIDGYEVYKRARKSSGFSQAKVIFHSANIGSEAREKAYELGAINYMEKPISKKEITLLIGNLLQEDKSKNSHIYILGNLLLDPEKFEASIGGKNLVLTPKEFRLLEYFCLCFERLVSRENIIFYLGEDNISDRTIDSHISHLRKKLIKSSLEIKAIYGEGYKMIYRNQ